MRATSECRPSAPTTTPACSSTVRRSFLPWPRIPTTAPASVTSSLTVKPSRISAPDSAAASISSLSSTVRRGAYATGNSGVPGDPERVKGPKSNAYVSIGGHPVAMTRSRRPQRCSAATPPRMDEVRGDRVAGEGRTVHDQDPVAVARQQHRSGGPGTPRADDDDVVLILVHVAPPRVQRLGFPDVAGPYAWTVPPDRALKSTW